MDNVDCEVTLLLSDILDEVCFTKPIVTSRKRTRDTSSQRTDSELAEDSRRRKKRLKDWGKNEKSEREASSEVAAWTEEDEDGSVPESVGGALCIFYTESPFSDFHTSNFMYDGKFYHSIEHFFQIQMIFSFGMFRLAQKIREIPEAAVFRKTLRQNLKTMVKSGLFSENMFAEWRKKNAFKMMRTGNKAKFEQNFTLKEQLIATGERLLIFTAKNDSLLGVGMTEAGFLHWLKTNRYCLEDLLDFFSGVRPRPKGLGRNYLGLALMEVRSELNGRASLLYEWKLQRPTITPEDWIGDTEPSGERVIAAPPDTSLPKVPALSSNKENTPDHETATPEDSSSAQIGPLMVESSEMNTIDDEPETTPAEDIPTPDNQFTPAPLPISNLEGSQTHAAVSRFYDQQRTQFLGTGQSQPGKEQEPLPLPETPTTGAAQIPESDTSNEVTDENQTKVAAVAAREVIILPLEKRIVYQRKDAEPRTIGEVEDSAPLPGGGQKKRTRPSRWEQKQQISRFPNSAEMNLSVLERLKSLKLDKPMINPFSLGNDKYDSFLKPAETNEQLNTYNEDGTVIAVEDEDEGYRVSNLGDRTPLLPEIPEPEYKGEPGELPPEWIPKYEYQMPRVVGRPAGLPFHLLRNLPPGPPPPGMEDYGPSHPMYPTSMLKTAGRPKRGPELPPMYYSTFVEAPTGYKKEREWEPPKDPALQMKIRARKLIEAAKHRAEREKIQEKIREEEAAEARAAEEARIQRLREMWGETRAEWGTDSREDSEWLDSEEGGTPQMCFGGKKKGEDDKPLIKEEIKEELEEERIEKIDLSKDKHIFPFGMRATLEDLLEMGFVPPPILTDPQCRSRNLGRSKDSWQFYFENPEAAFRHAANRWVRKGKLNTTGKYQEMEEDESDDDEEVDYNNYESSEDEEAEEEFQRKKKRFDTKIVYVDTFQYDEYVRYYQENHGCTPLPQEISGESLDVDGLRNWYHYYKTSVTPSMEAEVGIKDFTGEAAPDVFSSLSDYYAVSNWKERNKEGKETTEDEASLVDTRMIPQETWDNGVEIKAEPVVYEYDPKELQEWKEYEEELRKQGGGGAVKDEVLEVKKDPELVDLEKELEAVLGHSSSSQPPVIVL